VAATAIQRGTPIKRALRIFVSVSLIAYLINLVDFGETLRRIGSVDLAIAWLAIPLLLTQVFLSAFKWQQILRLSDIVLPLPFLVRTYLKGNFFSLFLPTSFGGDVYRVVRINQASGRLGDSASSVLFDRLTGLFALVTLAVVASILLPDMEYRFPLLGGYLLGILGFLLLTSAAAIEWLDRRVPDRLAKFMHPLRAFRAYRGAPRVLCAVLAIAFVFQFNIVVVNEIFSTALAIDIEFLVLMAIIPTIYLAEVIPISINGIGVRDSAFVFFFSYVGHSQEEGLAMAFLVLIFRYLVGSIGGLVFLAESLFGGPGVEPVGRSVSGSASDPESDA